MIASSIRPWFAGALLGLFAALPALAGPMPADALNSAVAERHLVPAYARLATTTAQLQATAEAGCDRQALRDRYREAFLAWQGIQHMRFGPIQVLSRDFRFQLWPDKRGAINRHLNALMSTPDPATLEPDTFAAGSAAVQGFGALERLLYTPPPDIDPDWECRVIGAMTANLARMARDTLHEWQDGDDAHRLLFADASEGNDYYDSADELSARLLNNLHTQLERVADQKLGRPLGTDPQHAAPRRAEGWRSGLSLDAIRENLAATEALYRIGFQPRVEAALDSQIVAGFGDARQRLDALDGPLDALLADPGGWHRIEAVRETLAELKLRIGRDLSTALGLPLGFNSLDGD